jgi:hypothetical protein
VGWHRLGDILHGHNTRLLLLLPHSNSHRTAGRLPTQGLGLTHAICLQQSWSKPQAATVTRSTRPR